MGTFVVNIAVDGGAPEQYLAVWEGLCASPFGNTLDWPMGEAQNLAIGELAKELCEAYFAARNKAVDSRESKRMPVLEAIAPLAVLTETIVSDIVTSIGDDVTASYLWKTTTTILAVIDTLAAAALNGLMTGYAGRHCRDEALDMDALTHEECQAITSKALMDVKVVWKIVSVDAFNHHTAAKLLKECTKRY